MRRYISKDGPSKKDVVSTINTELRRMDMWDKYGVRGIVHKSLPVRERKAFKDKLDEMATEEPQ